MTLNLDAYEAVLFDCDGTLVNSEELYNQVLVDVFNRHGLDFTLEYALHNWPGNTTRGIVTRVAAENGMTFPESVYDEISEHTIALRPQLMRPIDGALELVKYCAARRKVVVVSNGEPENVIESLALTGFLDVLDRNRQVFSLQDGIAPKPSPAPYLNAAKTIGVDPAKCLVFEDTIPGVTAGHAAGMDVIGVTICAHEPEKAPALLLQAGAQRTVSTYAGLTLPVLP